MDLYIFIPAAVITTVVVLIAGYVFLLMKRNIVISALLRERCIDKGIRMIIDPEQVVFDGVGKGMASLTEFELIFIPFKGKTPLNLNRKDMISFAVSERNPSELILDTDSDRYVLSLRDPGMWVEALKS